MTTTPQRMPAVFIGHGSPMNTLQHNRFTQAWRELGQALPRPRAVLCISAHWFIHGTAVTAMPRPRVIHDFYGFPRELFEYDYPAPGSPEVAREVAQAAAPAFIGLDEDSWGLDHGTWSVLAHVYPKADVPVLQLSIHGGAPPAYHLELGRRLAPLRERGILVLGSGNVVHNLRRMDRSLADRAYDWGERFDDEVVRRMTSDPASVAEIESHADYEMAVPTPEHFLPLLYIAGLADAAGERPRAFVRGGTMGGITMTGFIVGDVAAPAGGGGAGGSLPDPAVVPTDQTNT